MKAILMIAVCAALVLAGCGGTGDASGGSSELTSAEAAARSKPKVPQGGTQHKLVLEDLKEGTGAIARKGDSVFVHYVAGIYETGEEIESAWVKGDPYGFQLGSGSALPYWELALPGMRVGGRRVLIFPTTRKHAPIGSVFGDTLVYVIDLIQVQKKNERAQG